MIRAWCGLIVMMSLVAVPVVAGTLDLQAEGNTVGEHWQDSSYFTLERGGIITRYHVDASGASDTLIEEYSYELPVGVELEDIRSWKPDTIFTGQAEYRLSCSVHSGQIECEWTDHQLGPPGPPGQPVVVP